MNTDRMENKGARLVITAEYKVFQTLQLSGLFIVKKQRIQAK